MVRTFHKSVEYEDPNQAVLEIRERGAGARGTVDTEGAAIHAIEIHGRPAMLVEKEMRTTVLWNVDRHCLIVEYTGKRKEAVRVAESVVMIGHVQDFLLSTELRRANDFRSLRLQACGCTRTQPPL